MWVNTYRAVSYMSPFGGYKRSGLGRESGQEAIKEYLQIKSVWIATERASPIRSSCASDELSDWRMLDVGRMRRLRAIEWGFFAQLIKICATRLFHERR